ncbi:MAG: long-chain fatty acid--CoA ligase [Treponema sp.]|nr:long-chain fatty acid--CoA ligase [Treponema sp.]
MVFDSSYTVPKMIRDVVKKWPEYTAQFRRLPNGEFESITYKEMFQYALDFGAALISIGVKRSQNIAIIADNRPEWQHASIGIMSIGAVDVPRGCDASLIDLEKILALTECEIVIVENYAQANKIASLKDKLPKVKTLISFDKIEKPEVLESIKNAGFELLDFTELRNAGQAWRNHNPGAVEAELEKGKSEDLATLIFTSGTTGTPKGVMLIHQNFLAQLDELCERIFGNPGERALSVLPIWHVFEREVEYIMMIQGLSIVYSKPIGSILLADFKKMNPSILPAVPRVFEAIYDGILKKMRKTGGIVYKMFNFFTKVAIIHKRMQRKMFNKNPCFTSYHGFWWSLLFIIPWLLMWPLYGLGNLLVFRKIKDMLGNNFRGGVAGGGALPPNIDEFFWAIGIKLVEGFGMTETAPVVCVRPFACPIFGTIGSPIRGVQVRIADHDGFVLGRGKEGELQIKGLTVMKGYYKNPEKTAEAFTSDGWLHTGDLAIMTIHNELKIRGRIKDTIVLRGGENLEPLPIEMKLSESRYIKSSVIVGQDKRFISALILPDEEEIQNYASTNGLFYENYEELLKTSEIKKLFETEIGELINPKNGFKLFERVNRFAFLSKPFEVGVELSAKQEIMRYRIAEIYKDKIEELYKDE